MRYICWKWQTKSLSLSERSWKFICLFNSGTYREFVDIGLPRFTCTCMVDFLYMDPIWETTWLGYSTQFGWGSIQPKRTMASPFKGGSRLPLLCPLSYGSQKLKASFSQSMVLQTSRCAEFRWITWNVFVVYTCPFAAFLPPNKSR